MHVLQPGLQRAYPNTTAGKFSYVNLFIKFFFKLASFFLLEPHNSIDSTKHKVGDKNIFRL